jgi:carbamoyl-phosphate synthase small subunit
VKRKARLALESGRVFEGISLGAEGRSIGEAVFTTSMTGYVEVLTDLTDPSFFGQIVVATQPHMGNHGMQARDFERDRASVAGFAVGDAASWDGYARSRATLHDFLRARGVVGASGLPTRAITLELRRLGSLRAALSTGRESDKALVALARESPHMAGRSLSRFVTVKKPYIYGKGSKRVAVLDFGVKRSLLDALQAAGAASTVFPATAMVKDILKADPDAILLSNGPGDPAAMGPEIEKARELMKTGKPLLGVCLGHQLLGLAAGGTTYKLKFGHHGANHPVQDLATGKVLVTTQNHGFAVKRDSLPSEYQATYLSLNDGTLEGFRHKRKRIAAFQFHPEGGPGPREARELLAEFLGSF